MSKYTELRIEADKRWHTLTSSDTAWVRVGAAMCGQASGALEVIEALDDEIIKTNVNAKVSSVGCLGICFAETLVDVLKPGKPRVFFKNVTPEDIKRIVEEYILKDTVPQDILLGQLGDHQTDDLPNMEELPGLVMQERIAMRNGGHIAPDDVYQYVANDGYSALNKAIFEMEPEDVIKEMQNSGLRGRGGAAFPAGVKWSFLVRAPGPPKYILCNCEEGDPGAYNDKGILESDPHTLLEGMVLAGYATGSTNGYVFIRHGHDGPINKTETAIKQAYETGLLGKNILGSDFSFDIEIALTGDSYVAGEETALMESIEGKRSMPRSKPPFPAMAGLWGKPSNINNVKTYSYAPEIISRGSDWFSSIGTEKSTGTAIACLSGNIRYPGMYEVPMGMTLDQVVNDIGGGVPKGKKLKLLQTGGPLGGVLSADSLNIRIDFDEMQKAGAMFGSGGIIVADEDTCAVDLTRVLVAFCQYESCGKCFPCRLGMTHLLEFVERISSFQGTESDLDLMVQVGQTMQLGSLCAHGQLGFNPIKSALQHFGDEFRDHITEKRCSTGSCHNPRFAPRNTRPFGESFRDGVSPMELALSRTGTQ